MFLDNNKISIGENGLIGPFVQIYTASHPLKASERIIIRENKRDTSPLVNRLKLVTMFGLEEIR